MRMVPYSPSLRASNAERKVFYALKSIERTTDTYCFHSLALPNHAYKACCEIDFLILGPEGIFALEVKGGGVSCNEKGMWIMTDRDGREHMHREGPFKQVQGNFFALLDRLKQSLPPDEYRSMAKGWGVVFPDCAFEVNSVEWDNATVADQRLIGHLSTWLENLVRYYQKKCGCNSGSRIAPDTLRSLRRLLRPIFERFQSLAGEIDTAEMTVNTLTEDQSHAVDIFEANPRVLCCGGAGTGKTFLALELARRNLSENRTVTLCCSTPWLKNFLDAKISHPALNVLTIEQLRRRSGQPIPSDVLIVDEGQDMMNMQDLDALDKIPARGLTAGCWSFFYDCNNQTGLVGRWDPKSLDFLKSIGATQIPLTRNCRNTRQIVDEVARRTGCQMGSKEQGEGPSVKAVRVRQGDCPAKTLESTMESLLGNGISSSQITILSPLRWDDSSVSSLPGNLLKEIVQLDEYSLRSFPPSRISFARIQDFKGLENTAIILVDIDQDILKASPPSMVYVGMSRARAYLVLIIRE